jgi:hypothetical protein
MNPASRLQLNTVDKETFLAGVLCLTKGWYVRHAEEKAPTPGLQWRFHAGSDAAAKAREWLGPGRMLRRTPLKDAIDSTAAAVTDPASTLLFEASFQSGQCVARADALRREADGWNLLEIKTGKSPADGEAVKDEYIEDIAYTAWVASSGGLPLAKQVLVLVNREYRTDGPAPMFVAVDVTDLVRPRMVQLEAMSAAVVAAALQNDRPTPSLTLACRDCEFFATDCIGAGVNDPLFAIPRLSVNKFEELRNHERLRNLPTSAKLTESQMRVVDVFRSGTPAIDGDGLRLLDSLTYPVYYLDFEAVSPHFPWFDGRPPYDPTVFQFSLHVLTAPGTDAEHRSYLAPVEGDWRRELTANLLTALGSSGSIVVYSHYEKTQLRSLAELYPDLAQQIGAVIERLFDLEEVIRRGYVHPRFGGRTSIKKVLPVVAPDLDYESLDIRSGDDAAGNFALMRVGETPEELHSTHRAALHKYCHLDTLALVRIHDFLAVERSKLE